MRVAAGQVVPRCSDEPVGQLIVWPVGRSDEMAKGGVSGQDGSGARVQAGSRLAPQVVVHSGSHQGVGEADGPSFATFRVGQDRGGGTELLERLMGMLDGGNGRHEVDSRPVGQQGSRPGQALGRLGVRGQRAGHQQGVRRRGRQRRGCEERLGGELVEQRAEVQRAPGGVSA